MLFQMFNIDDGSIHEVEENDILQLPLQMRANPPQCFCIVSCNENGECEEVGGFEEDKLYNCCICKLNCLLISYQANNKPRCTLSHCLHCCGLSFYPMLIAHNFSWLKRRIKHCCLLSTIYSVLCALPVSRCFHQIRLYLSFGPLHNSIAKLSQLAISALVLLLIWSPQLLTNSIACYSLSLLMACQNSPNVFAQLFWLVAATP